MQAPKYVQVFMYSFNQSVSLLLGIGLNKSFIPFPFCTSDVPFIAVKTTNWCYSKHNSFTNIVYVYTKYSLFSLFMVVIFYKAT